ADWFAQNNIAQPEAEAWGVGMVFLPQASEKITELKQYIDKLVTVEGLQVLGWREVPVRPEVLGQQARDNQPHIEQIVVSSPDGLVGDDLERKLYIARSRIGKKLADDFYICSFSCRTVVYKGMVRAVILGDFYQDLANSDYESTFAVYHRRFSTNTMPKWPFAQPMRILGHNGEINTLLGNINWMSNREKELIANNEVTLPGWTHDEIEGLMPIVNNDTSDSYNLDSAMELLVRTGRSVTEAAMILVPEAYQNQPSLKEYPEIVDFYEYHSGQQEAWDGPALLVFSDGKTVGAALDRNGLRPARYTITKDGYVVVGSETGVVNIPDEEIVEKGRLGPGQTIVVDLKTKEVLRNWEVKQRVAQANPYGKWIEQHRQTIAAHEFNRENLLSADQLLSCQTAFGYTAEDLELIIQSMAINGKEPTFCMGDDIPLAVLSDKPRLLYDYFKQRFAQVTNPAIDPLRESLVMSLSMQLGAKGNILNLKAEDARLLKLESPVLNDEELAAIKSSDFKTQALSTLYRIASGPDGLKDAVTQLCAEATTAVQAGIEIIVLSDRPAAQNIGTEYSYLPPLLAIGAVHHHLIQQGLRLRTSLVVDTAQCWSTHHFACLIGYGASAVCPYLTLESVRQWWNNPKTQKLMENERIEALSLAQAQQNYRQSIEAGLLKILSKMGISLLSSYHGAQIFEALGLGVDLVNLAFTGTTSRLGGLTVAELAQEVIAFHHKAFPELLDKKLENYGFVKYKKGGEYHMNSPEMSKALHKAVESKDYDHYELYKQQLHGRPATALRDLLDFKSDRPSISLDEVESVESIFKRFCTGGMSLGSLSREAHETLAIAMNRIGGKSNSGEGGEDTIRFKVLDDVGPDGKTPTLPHLNGLINGDTAS
ncbi:MAG: ferredoxin-dependent glutamate synthase, partial [Cyanobacteriota bacterium]